jgi:hypothetical protein
MLLSNVGVRTEQRQRVFLGFGRNNKTRSNPATQSTYCASNWLTIIHAVQRRVGFGARIAAGHLCLPDKSGTIAVPAFQPVVDGSSLQPMSTDGHTNLICTEAAIGFYILHLQGVILSDISLDSLAVLQDRCQLQETCYTTRQSQASSNKDCDTGPVYQQRQASWLRVRHQSTIASKAQKFSTLKELQHSAPLKLWLWRHQQAASSSTRSQTRFH